MILMESVKIFPRRLNMLNVVPRTQQIILQPATILLKMSHRPTLYSNTLYVMDKLV